MNLVLLFYAQSTSTVISRRADRRIALYKSDLLLTELKFSALSERAEHVIIIQYSSIAKLIVSPCFWLERHHSLSCHLNCLSRLSFIGAWLVDFAKHCMHWYTCIKCKIPKHPLTAFGMFYLWRGAFCNTAQCSAIQRYYPCWETHFSGSSNHTEI